MAILLPGEGFDERPKAQAAIGRVNSTPSGCGKLTRKAPSDAHHRERRTTKLGVNLFNKLGPLCEYTQLLRKTEWTEPIHLVHKMELKYCMKCNGQHWWIVDLVEHDERMYTPKWQEYDNSDIMDFIDIGYIVDTSNR